MAIETVRIEPDLNSSTLDPKQATHIRIEFNNGSIYRLSYVELRFYCPCAVCVDEHTGRRVLKRENLSEAVRPLGVEPVGRYAVKFAFSDGHSTGIYPHERILEICKDKGAVVSTRSQEALSTTIQTQA